MKTLFYTIVIVLLSTLPAYGTSEQVMRDMISYIEQNSKYVYNGEPLPIIEIHPAIDICRDMYTEDVLEEMGGECGIAGYYNDITNTIVISDDPGEFMVEEYFIETVLFHEMVHFLQFANGEDHVVECKKELEMDAYILQEQYVEDMGYPEEQKPNMLFAIFASSCKKSWY